jgi:hypothetical protein
MAYEVSAGLTGKLQENDTPIFFRLVSQIINENLIDPLIKFIETETPLSKGKLLRKIRSMRGGE